MATPSQRRKGVVESVGLGNPSNANPGLNKFERIQGEGLQVVMRPIPGFTDPNALFLPFVFQCPPMDDFAHVYPYQWTDYNTVSHGQFTRPAGVQLATISFSTLFLDWNATWTLLRVGPNGRPPDILAATVQLRRVMNSGTPFELIVANYRLWGQADVHWAPANGNAARLNQITFTEKAGEVDARYVDVQFSEFRSPELMRRGNGGNPGAGPSSSSKADTGKRDENRGRSFPQKIQINADGSSTNLSVPSTGGSTPGGVTLSSIAQQMYGQASGWRRIAQASGITDFSPNRPLSEYLKAHKEKQIKIIVPAPPGRTKEKDN